MKAMRVIVSGVVQGVGFRAFTARKAQSLGLHGWVRNRHDGTVEAVVAGEDKAVDSMLERLKEGPQGSAVSGIDVRPYTDPVAPGFETLPTV